MEQHPRRMWRQAYLKMVPCGVLFIGGAALSSIYGNVRRGSIDHKIIALCGVILFLIFSIAFLNVFINAVRHLITHYRLNSDRIASIPFVLRIIGYVAILMSSLELVGISVERLLVGGAVLGIILGVAAQQALGNFFASIVLVISHPFAVGDYITIVSGALGGQYKGKVVYIGLTHTRIRDDEGNTVFLPNSTILSNASIMSQKRKKAVAPSGEVDAQITTATNK
jgi:small conductance mechanosensitive channel